MLLVLITLFHSHDRAQPKALFTLMMGSHTNTNPMSTCTFNWSLSIIHLLPSMFTKFLESRLKVVEFVHFYINPVLSHRLIDQKAHFPTKSWVERIVILGLNKKVGSQPTINSKSK